MIRYECDKCGAALGANDGNRYIVKMEIFAAAGPLELDLDEADDSAESMATMLDELAKADPDDLEDKTYRSFRFDVCDACRRILLARPLGV
jgi:hypothetical protein